MGVFIIFACYRDWSNTQLICKAYTELKFLEKLSYVYSYYLSLNYVGERFLELGDIITEENQDLPMEIEVILSSSSPVLNLHFKETPSAQQLVNF